MRSTFKLKKFLTDLKRGAIQQQQAERYFASMIRDIENGKDPHRAILLNVLRSQDIPAIPWPWTVRNYIADLIEKGRIGRKGRKRGRPKGSFTEHPANRDSKKYWMHYEVDRIYSEAKKNGREMTIDLAVEEAIKVLNSKQESARGFNVPTQYSVSEVRKAYYEFKNAKADSLAKLNKNLAKN